MSLRQLPSARARDAQANLDAFIAAGKNSTAFGPVDFEAAVWSDLIVATRPVTEGRPLKARLYFLTGRGATRGAADEPPMRKPFVDFVKAAIRLQEDAGPKRHSRHANTIAACRVLHDALAEVDYDPCRALPRHFTVAIRAIEARSTGSGAHQAGLALARVAAWIDQYGIGRVRLGWKSPIRTFDRDNRISDEAARVRAHKMPSATALEALPRLSRLVTDPADVLRMHVVELLVCGGWRINELLELPADCEVTEEIIESGQVKLRYGIRYWGAKGFGATIKWIPTPMIDVAQRAIAGIKAITRASREDARWMHDNPERHPMLAGFDPEHLFTIKEVQVLLGMGGPVVTLRWLRHQGTAVLQRRPGFRRSDCFVSAASLEKTLLKVIATWNAPGRVPLHQALFLVRTHQLHSNRTPINGTLERLPAKTIRDFITGAVDRKAVFERFNFMEPDGSPIRVRTHQFRHWLNTLAQEGGMSQELIARWSSRKDIQQNAVYDHVSGTKLAEKVRALAEAGEVIGQIARVRESLPLADRRTFLRTQIPTSHVTEIGICIHDWSLVPCAIHGQCADCAEHLIDKGNAKQREEAERQVAEVELFLQQANVEDTAGTYGASRWADAHKRRLAGLKGVLAVHVDPTIADGTMVHLGVRGPDQAVKP